MEKLYKQWQFWLVLLVVLCVLVLSIRMLTDSREPHFKIYKEECREEIILSGKKLIRTESTYIDCNKTITIEGDKRCFNKTKDNMWDCEEDYCRFYSNYHYENIPLTTVVVEIIVEDYREEVSNNIFEDFVYTEEVCEQVEVDGNEEIWVDKYKEEGNAIWGILAKNINERWLDENCECVNINQPCEDLECKAGGKCQKYKCGEYIVENLGKINEN